MLSYNYTNLNLTCSQTSSEKYSECWKCTNSS